MRAEFKVRAGSSDRLVVVTRGHQFFFSTRWLGVRLRLLSSRPYVWIGRA